MAAAKKHHLKINESPGRKWLGAVPSFIFLNGVILTVIVFFLLRVNAVDMMTVDARNITRDILRSTEQSMKDIEKTVTTLATIYASLSDGTAEDLQTTQRMQKVLTQGAEYDALIWATEKDVWHQDRRLAAQPDNNTGWPAYLDLYQRLSATEENQVLYMSNLPWAAFSVQPLDPSLAPIALAVRRKLPSGGMGILMVVTTPARLFGSSWNTRTDDIARVTIRDRQTNEVLVNKLFDMSRSSSMFEMAATEDIVQMGNQSWSVRFQVWPTGMSKFLYASPWLASFMILFMTFVAAAIAEKKHRQDQKMAAMTKDLEGAHTELQSRISERDKLFHALRKSERENRAVINSVSDVIFETDETGKLVFLNETWKKVTHREIADTLGHSLFGMIDLTDQVKQKEMFDELVRGERQAYRSETRLHMGQGVLKPVEIAFSMLRMTEDKSIRVVGTLTDIEKRRKAETAMREAERRFRNIVENSISGIYQTSPEGRFISANPALAEILGYASAEDLMESVTDISQQIYVRPEDRKAFVQKVLFEGRVSGIEAEVRCKDGRKIWIMENARVVRSEKGGVSYYEGSIWDVTERREAEEAMRQAKVQAEMSSRSRMEFLANMSHELRTPLNAVIGFSEIIKDEIMGPVGVPSYKEYARDIYDSGNYLLKVISEILEVSKIETGNRELNLSHFRLPKALKACLVIISSRVEQSGVELKTDISEDLPEIWAEELGFKQIFLNLIGNAIKFTPKGGKVEVSARVDVSGDMIIDISDTGIGMTEDEIKKAMQPFSKVDTSFSGMKEGTGLGLTIVEALVRLHGGQFRLISQKGVGTTARVIIPAARVMRPTSTAGSDGAHLKVIK